MQRNAASHVTVIVQQGRVLDFIDGSTQRLETPEEYVRQEISKSLVREYGYPRSDISVEFTLRFGSRKPRADLVVFHASSEHDQASAYIVVECKEQKVKAADRKEGVGQLQSYMASCPNAEYGMWTNGLERHCYKKVVRSGRVTFEEVPDLPTYGQSPEDSDRPKFEQLKPASSDALLFAFRRCHNYIAGNQGLQKPQAFWELLKLIFCKIHDERRSPEVEFFASAAERTNINGQLKVKKRVDALFEVVKAEFPAIFQHNDVVALNPPVLAYIVTQLQMYSLLESDVDVKGHAYEEIVGSNLRGDRGEFFTPRNVCNMAVSMLDPQENQLVLDPACGTGGFLIAAMNHVIEKIRAAELAKWKGNYDRAEPKVAPRIAAYAGSSIVGIDFNPELVKATKMNMVMNNDGAGGLYQANSLASQAVWPEALRDRNLLGAVDLIFTNPPFGSKIPIDDPAILEKYDLGHIWSYDAVNDRWEKTPSVQKSQPPEILFIERCVRFLKPGSGRAAMVLPDGILGSPGLGYLRAWILENTRVLASIDLHPDTFQPNVSVQTSLLVFERKTESQVALERAAGKMADYPIFMAVANHIGHDKRGNKTYVRDKKGNEIVEEIEEKQKEYENGRIVYRTQKTLQKVLDDNTLDIAKAFREWQIEHS
ncbi:N-6 DNA methylase [Xanthomonas citri pv. fuscans CFBP 6996]|uniref:N-6 DNA methylase n=1 Tax=Xanthomonas citri TaxID=346 RepID=UPI000C18F579|nr:N-6 DNA methylase [Xanthomonas citri]ATS50337.1 N-6 DNA methylase [Xanthomonas citri pv. phaseoli var. fuscans]ATS56073.1 N-6 DNA methylase [Xanthomonas citri pv. phaseoli var. fuscans]ATS59912.1 N-6 DNA methylase [Xanthomonas citri pv. phaseoli var. fuscans]PTY31012.1 N-6 DNA methylase [Xanthomonas citri pv. fuscans CFBP 6996]QWN14947.1 N-6 DNA methylase [Xanthomonas citri]